MSEETLTFNQTVQAIAEFIKVAIHTILYVRQIYPAEVFVRRKKFDTPVYQSRHPALNEYISGAVKAVADELAHGKVNKVVVVIKDKEQTALERFIFSVETMIHVEGFNKDIGVEEAMTPSSLVQYFRSFLVKLNMIETQIGQMYLGNDASFAVVIELKDDAAPTQSHTTKSSKSSGQADRAKHPDELRKGGAGLTIDYQYYLSHQILPPIERLCEPIEGTDRARLAECLGLDPMRYRDTVAGGDDRVFSGLDSQLSDSERFRDAAPFVIRCRHCQVQVPFVPLNDADANILASSGPGCPACSKNISSTQLGVQIRDAIAKYYEGWTRCDAPTCNNRTGMMGVYGRRCLKSNCKGRVSFEYSDTQLYNQLRYFVSLFDGEKALTLAPPNRREEIAAIVLKNQMILRTLTDCVERHLNHCGRRWIDLSVIFSAMRV